MERNWYYFNNAVRHALYRMANGTFNLWVVQLCLSFFTIRTICVVFSKCFRSNQQIKSHGQKMAVKWNAGENIFEQYHTYNQTHDRMIISNECPSRHTESSTLPMVDSSNSTDTFDPNEVAKILCIMKNKPSDH